MELLAPEAPRRPPGGQTSLICSTFSNSASLSGGPGRPLPLSTRTPARAPPPPLQPLSARGPQPAKAEGVRCPRRDRTGCRPRPWRPIRGSNGRPGSPSACTGPRNRRPRATGGDSNPACCARADRGSVQQTFRWVGPAGHAARAGAALAAGLICSKYPQAPIRPRALPKPVRSQHSKRGTNKTHLYELEPLFDGAARCDA